MVLQSVINIVGFFFCYPRFFGNSALRRGRAALSIICFKAKMQETKPNSNKKTSLEKNRKPFIMNVIYLNYIYWLCRCNWCIKSILDVLECCCIPWCVFDLNGMNWCITSKSIFHCDSLLRDFIESFEKKVGKRERNLSDFRLSIVSPTIWRADERVRSERILPLVVWQQQSKHFLQSDPSIGFECTAFI